MTLILLRKRLTGIQRKPAMTQAVATSVTSTVDSPLPRRSNPLHGWIAPMMKRSNRHESIEAYPSSRQSAKNTKITLPANILKPRHLSSATIATLALFPWNSPSVVTIPCTPGAKWSHARVPPPIGVLESVIEIPAVKVWLSEQEVETCRRNASASPGK